MSKLQAIYSLLPDDKQEKYKNKIINILALQGIIYQDDIESWDEAVIDIALIHGVKMLGKYERPTRYFCPKTQNELQYKLFYHALQYIDPFDPNSCLVYKSVSQRNTKFGSFVYGQEGAGCTFIVNFLYRDPKDTAGTAWKLLLEHAREFGFINIVLTPSSPCGDSEKLTKYYKSLGFMPQPFGGSSLIYKMPEEERETLYTIYTKRNSTPSE